MRERGTGVNIETVQVVREGGTCQHEILRRNFNTFNVAIWSCDVLHQFPKQVEQRGS